MYIPSHQNSQRCTNKLVTSSDNPGKLHLAYLQYWQILENQNETEQISSPWTELAELL